MITREHTERTSQGCPQSCNNIASSKISLIRRNSHCMILQLSTQQGKEENFCLCPSTSQHLPLQPFTSCTFFFDLHTFQASDTKGTGYQTVSVQHVPLQIHMDIYTFLYEEDRDSFLLTRLLGRHMKDQK